MDVTVGTYDGEFEGIDTSELPVTGRDGYGQKTPTIRELIDILKAIPEEFQGLPVGRYGDEGIRGLQYKLHWSRDEDLESWTPYAQLW